MRWPRHSLASPHQGRTCREVGCIPHWEPLTVNGQHGQLRICKRRDCRNVTSVVLYGHTPAVARGIDATCSTDNRPATDWPGCTD